MGGLEGQGAAMAGLAITAECCLAIGTDGASSVVLTSTKQAPSRCQPPYRLHYAAGNRRCVIHCPWISRAPTRVDSVPLPYTSVSIVFMFWLLCIKRDIAAGLLKSARRAACMTIHCAARLLINECHSRRREIHGSSGSRTLGRAMRNRYSGHVNRIKTPPCQNLNPPLILITRRSFRTPIRPKSTVF